MLAWTARHGCTDNERAALVVSLISVVLEKASAFAVVCYLSPLAHHLLIMPADLSARPQALTGKHASPAAAAEHLEKLFSEGAKHEGRRVTVLLVDEMDLLITKKQQVCFWIPFSAD